MSCQRPSLLILAKSVFEVAVSDRPGRVRNASPTLAHSVLAIRLRVPPRHNPHGGLWERALLGALCRGIWAPRRASSPACRAPLRSTEQDRSHGHQRTSRGVAQRGNPGSTGQVDSPANSGCASPAAFDVAGDTNRSHQHRPRFAPRVRNHDSRRVPPSRALSPRAPFRRRACAARSSAAGAG
jgi:hypothetical protein